MADKNIITNCNEDCGTVDYNDTCCSSGPESADEFSAWDVMQAYYRNIAEINGITADSYVSHPAFMTEEQLKVKYKDDAFFTFCHNDNIIGAISVYQDGDSSCTISLFAMLSDIGHDMLINHVIDWAEVRLLKSVIVFIAKNDEKLKQIFLCNGFCLFENAVCSDKFLDVYKFTYRTNINDDEILNETDENIINNTAVFYDLDPRNCVNDDIPFYLSYEEQAKSGVLELGCGTGRVAIPMAQAGYNITGLDLSLPMLSQFDDKVNKLDEAVKNRIHIVHGDMKDFSLDRKFGLITAPFRAFQSLLKHKDITSALSCIHSHLEHDGLFILSELDILPFTRPFQSLKMLMWVLDATEPITDRHIVKEHCIKRINHTIDVMYLYHNYKVLNGDGTYTDNIDKLQLKFFSPQQLKKLLNDNGFTVMEEYGWYDKSPIKRDREIIFVCGKKDFTKDFGNKS